MNAEAGLAGAAPAAPRQVIVVEQDDSLREVVSSILRHAGLQVEAIANPDQAFGLIEALPGPVLLFLDPWDLSGEVAQALHVALGARGVVVTLGRDTLDPAVVTALCPVASVPMPFHVRDLVTMLVQYCSTTLQTRLPPEKMTLYPGSPLVNSTTEDTEHPVLPLIDTA